MSYRHVICLVVDGLRASALGTYGNTMYPTPQLDALASRSQVTDWFWADSPHLADFYRSAWQGTHALRGETPDASVQAYASLAAANVRQQLSTDEPWLAELAEKLNFDDVQEFENIAQKPVLEIEDSSLGQFFAGAIGELPGWRQQSSESNSITWIHSRGLYGPWDAPVELREELLDEEDPPIDEFVQPPTELRDVEDPDTLLAFRVAYAAQIKLFDICVGALVEAINETYADTETLFMLTGSRGFALGEHGAIGTDCTELFSERLHTPWLLYPCGNTEPLPRQASLAQPADIHTTMLDWLGVEPSSALNDAPLKDGVSLVPSLNGEVLPQRQLAIATGDLGQRAVRTPAWLMLQSPSADSGEVASSRLFTKPADRWESNDVQARCSEIVEGLSQELANAEDCASENKAIPLAPTADELILPWQ